MIRVLPVALEVILLVFCLIECIITEETRIRNLPKWAWVLLIVLLPLVGGVAWLIAGRPRRASRNQEPPPPAPSVRGPAWERPPYPRPKAPDDDPEFLASLKKENTDHERLLKQWEDDLRRREEELRDQTGNGDPNPDDQR